MIADRDELDADGRANLALKAKHLIAQGYLNPEPDPNSNATSAKHYRSIELARAAILTDAMVAGFQSKALTVIAKSLEVPPRIFQSHPPSAKNGDSYFYAGGALACAVRGVLKNDPGQWRLDFSCGREAAKEPIWIANVIYLSETDPEPASFLGTLRRPVARGTFDLTSRLSQFSDLISA